jgi:UDP-3-O-[3-hydroxymyristoyl] glucosamine N-acyltransferase
LDFQGTPADEQVYFYVKNPSWALAEICAKVEREQTVAPVGEIHATAVVSPNASIAASASIGPFCVIGDAVVVEENVFIGSHCSIGHGCKIGAHSILKAHVTLYDRCQIGQRVIIHSGAVIGADGFGYEFVDGIHRKLAHIGNVNIGNDVEIGANTTIDRARFASTHIGDGTKIDNLVQIGHNVQVGRCCLIVAQVGIAGSSKLGNFVILGGQVGVVGHISIGDGAKVAAQGGVSRNVEANATLRGSPAMPMDSANRYYVVRKYIPQLLRRVDSLEEMLLTSTEKSSPKCE